MESRASGSAAMQGARLGAAAAAAGLALVASALLGAGGDPADGRSGLALTFGHSLLAAAAVVLAAPGMVAGLRRWGSLAAFLCAVPLLVSLLLRTPPLSRALITWLHVTAGVALLGVVIWACRGSFRFDGRRRWLIPALLFGLLAAYAGAEVKQTTWAPPRYDSEACYRFLTATAGQQSGLPLFPSALQAKASAPPTCQSNGCHARVHEGWKLGAHTTSASSPAYQRTYVSFVTRRGEEAGRWCRGCHQTEALAAGLGADAPGAVGEGLTCGSCHRAETVHALYGAAALRLRSTDAAEERLAPKLRPGYHTASNFREGLMRSPELCGACHRKNWSLPQNDFHWMAGPDEFGQWQGSRYATGALFAAGDRTAARSCLGCHSSQPAAAAQEAPDPSGLRLDLFVRRGPGGRQVDPAERASLTPGEKLQLDVVVQNTGIGHDFPTGMPDLQESWLEVTLLDRSGRTISGNGEQGPGSGVDPGVHVYRLVALNQAGEPLRHGDLDRWRRTGEWRRIPAGSADLARYTMAAPRGVGSVRVRLLRRRRVEFSRWAGEPVQAPEVLAKVTRRFGQPEEHGEVEAAVRWRAYGAALAGVKNFPQALNALQRAETLKPSDAETRLALGRVYLEEGDLLAAQDQFHRVQAVDPERGRAWEGAVLRRMGQPDQAAALLEPLARRYPRDGRLRFELGSAYMAALRNEEAAREFEAVLDVDPIDARAHYSLMFCLQRLNRLTAARREETIYQLLRSEGDAAGGKNAFTEDRPLHEHILQERR